MAAMAAMSFLTIHCLWSDLRPRGRGSRVERNKDLHWPVTVAWIIRRQAY